MTPLGSPVEPEVYMSTASDSGVGGVGSNGVALPSSITSAHERTLGPLAAPLIFPSHSVGVQRTSVYTIARSEGMSPMFLSTVGTALRLQTSTVTPPCLQALITASIPRVAYAVATTTFCEKAPWAAISRSAEVSS